MLGLCVVELVDHQHLVGVRGDVLHAVGGERLDAGENVLPPLRPSPTHIQLAEVAVGQDLPVGPQGLLEDLLPVGHEQQRGPGPRLLAQASVVQCRHHGLAGAGGRHDEVAVTVVDLSFRLQRLEHLQLVGEGSDLQPRQRQRDAGVLLASCCLRESVVETVVVDVRVVELVGGVVPVRLEGRAELLQQGGRGHAGEPDVPLDPVQQRSSREVGRPHVGGVEARPPMEHPGLGMQTCPLGVVLDAYLGVELADQPVQGGSLRGAHVGRRDHT